MTGWTGRWAWPILAAAAAHGVSHGTSIDNARHRLAPPELTFGAGGAMQLQDLKDFIEHHAVAGAAGAAVAASLIRGESVAGRLIKLLSGTAIAGWVTPLAADFAGIAGRPAAVGAIGFLLGLFGLALMNQIMRAIDGLRAADALQSWITKR